LNKPAGTTKKAMETPILADLHNFNNDNKSTTETGKKLILRQGIKIEGLNL